MKIIRKLFWKLLFLLPYPRSLYTKIISIPLEKKTLSKEREEIHNFLTFALSSVPYYRDSYLVQNQREIQLTKLPILKKKIAKTQSNNLLADSYQKMQNELIFNFNKSPLRNLWDIFFKNDFLIKMTTGGTTGTPITCYKNKESLYTEALLFIRGWKMMGYNPGDKVLIFYNRYYDYDLSWVNNLSFLHGIRLFFFDSLNPEIINRLMNEINTFKPDFIVTFPSYLNYAVMEIKKQWLLSTHKIKGIEVSGETLFPHQRAYCQEIFKAPVYNAYGAIEVGNVIAHECRYRNGMHVFEDIVRMEEKVNKLIITRFDAREMPFIRYEIGDRGKLKYEKCPCGIEGLKLEEVEGRIEDYLLLQGKKRIYPSAFRQIINSCNEKFSNSIMESKIIQTSLKRIIINIVLDEKEDKDKIKSSLMNSFRRIIPASVDIIIKFPAHIKPGRKLKFIERKM